MRGLCTQVGSVAPRNMNREHLRRGYPEAQFGGFSDVDGSVAFYARISALLTPEMSMVDFGCGRGAQAEDTVVYRRNLRIFRGRVRKVVGVDVDPVGSNNPTIDEFRLLTPGGM